MPRESPQGFLLLLAADGIKDLIRGAASLALGPAGCAAGAASEYFGPALARRWEAWRQAAPPAEARAEFEAAANLPAPEALARAREGVEAAAPKDASAEDKVWAARYVAAIPAALRAALPREEKSGRSACPAALLPRDEGDVLRLLPATVPPFPVPHDLPGTDYRLVEVLGSGGCGVVYKAINRHEPWGDLRAMKFCLDPQLAFTLRRDASLLEKLILATVEAGRDWPAGIVRLLGHRLDATPPFLIYEYAAGGDMAAHLTARLRQTGRPLPAGEALEIVRAIAEPLAFAHAQGLVHRDLKLSNVLRGDDRSRVLKLTDFGIAAAVDGGPARSSRHTASLEQSRLLRGAGSDLYMSDEQRRGEAPDPRHDLYSLGVIWFQLLSGDLSRRMGPGWREELLEDVNSPPAHVDLIGLCIGRMKNRPADAAALLKELDRLLQKPSSSGHVVGQVDAGSDSNLAVPAS